MHFTDDILVGIFAYLNKGNRQFYHDRQRVHEFFYEQKSLYSVLKDVPFRTKGLFPESRELDQAYSNLVASGLLFSWSPRFNPHEISSECRTYFSTKLRKHFSADELRELEELSQKFQTKFCLESALSE